MFAREEQAINAIEIVSNMDHCYLAGTISNPYAFTNKLVILYSKEGVLKNKPDELLGNMANPLVLYKTNRDGRKMLCITSSEQIAKQLPEESCY